MGAVDIVDVSELLSQLPKLVVVHVDGRSELVGPGSRVVLAHGEHVVQKHLHPALPGENVGKDLLHYLDLVLDSFLTVVIIRDLKIVGTTRISMQISDGIDANHDDYKLHLLLVELSILQAPQEVRWPVTSDSQGLGGVDVPVDFQCIIEFGQVLSDRVPVYQQRGVIFCHVHVPVVFVVPRVPIAIVAIADVDGSEFPLAVFFSRMAAADEREEAEKPDGLPCRDA
mmetsp:Transcript_34292/g.97178  ORF Transcript_34292/g.97178 Transcript_34292/m.97178 type:complete len:227 (+) Transcript_34292:515-1195(+)|eukprot:CAMPEP_0117676044 /NCGR_PEP_ID=MMETSP0804-20121206/15940_1 /TAXON_ID=1074897 /ORGANISM="Tetraselmis astigmatica, Strain CCMP880" /LENGTH=226 /DNA_ID=CAMNT_0005485111 /DNA_START=471 /DNA_END=1151 /DNA_ORIENTATION=+